MDYGHIALAVAVVLLLVRGVRRKRRHTLRIIIRWDDNSTDETGKHGDAPNWDG